MAQRDRHEARPVATGLTARAGRTGGAATPREDPPERGTPGRREGRTARFEREALPHLEELRRAAWRMTRNPHEAEDLLQETLTKALAGFDRFQAGTNARAWLHRIMHNIFVSGLRTRGREYHVGDLTDISNDRGTLDPSRRPADTHAPEEQVLRRDRGESIRAALGGVPSRFRAVVLLVDLKGYSYAETAAILKVPVGTVMSRLHRGRRRLRARLGEGRRTTAQKGDPLDRGNRGTRPVVDPVPLVGEHERP